MAKKYNEKLQTNNSSLEEILDKLNNLPDAGEGGIDTSDATATAAEILYGKTAYVNGEKITGRIPTKEGNQTIIPNRSYQEAVGGGYYVRKNITVAGDAQLLPTNIKAGISIFGVIGTYEGTTTGTPDYSGEDKLIEGMGQVIYSNSRITKIGKGAFAYGEFTRIDAINCTSVSDRAFYTCVNLSTVNLPQCSRFGSSAFLGCTKLLTVSFPLGVSVSAYTFYDCIRLTSINMPNLSQMGSHSFENCSSLTSIDFPLLTTVGWSGFRSCNALSSINLPICWNIASEAFAQCSALTYVELPKLQYCGDSAFSNCRSLTEINIPECVNIRPGGFYNCFKLSSINAPKLKNIDAAQGYGVFQYCSSLAKIIFPVCSFIGSRAFYSCASLSMVSLDICHTIGQSTFQLCSRLQDVYIPKLEVLGSGVFSGCINLTSINFPLCLSINNYTFTSCDNLQTVILKNCSAIGAVAFRYCSKLTNLTLGSTSVVLLSNVNTFYNTPLSASSYVGQYGSIYVPASLVDAYKSATNWATYASRITAITEDTGGDSGSGDEGGSGDISLITFTIDGTSYQAEEGMTWEQWVNSDYNNGDFDIRSNTVHRGMYCVMAGIHLAMSTATIVSNYAYTLELDEPI